MSRIYFHTLEGTAEIQGRAYMKRCISDWFASILDIPRSFKPKSISTFLDLIPKDCYLQNSFKTTRDFSDWLLFADRLQFWVRVNDDSYFQIGDYKIDMFGVQLNTAYLIGSDPVKLMARLHGQCERHCYIEGDNREWLAQIIEKGLKTCIYRQEQGWDSVITLLRNGCNSPVVTSYSVCQPFPNFVIANFEPSIDEHGEEVWDDWYNLQSEDQWELGMQGLRQQSKSLLLELNPQAWEDFYFSHGWDAFKLNHLLSTPKSKWEQLAKAFNESQLPAPEAWTYALSVATDTETT